MLAFNPFKNAACWPTLAVTFQFKNCSTQIFKFKLQFSFVIYSLFKPIRGHRLFELLSFWAFYLLARLNWPPWTAGWTIILKLIRHNLINKSGLKKPYCGFVSRKCSVSKSPSETSEFVINSNTIISTWDCNYFNLSTLSGWLKCIETYYFHYFHPTMTLSLSIICHSEFP